MRPEHNEHLIHCREWWSYHYHCHFTCVGHANRASVSIMRIKDLIEELLFIQIVIWESKNLEMGIGESELLATSTWCIGEGGQVRACRKNEKLWQQSPGCQHGTTKVELLERSRKLLPLWNQLLICIHHLQPVAKPLVGCLRLLLVGRNRWTAWATERGQGLAEARQALLRWFVIVPDHSTYEREASASLPLPKSHISSALGPNSEPYGEASPGECSLPSTGKAVPH